MGVGDWFKRFKRNAAALEEYREGEKPSQDASQAARAAAEHSRVSSERASTSNQDSSGEE